MMLRTVSAIALACALAGCARRPAQQMASAQPTAEQQPPPANQPPAATAPAPQPQPQSAQPAEPAPAPAPEPAPAPAPAPTHHRRTARASASAPQPAAVEKPSAFRGGPQAEPAKPVPVVVTIPAGTRIRVRLGETLDTKHVRPGERFIAHLDDPILEGNRVVVPKGAVFHGHVVEAKTSGRFRGRAYLGVTLDSFQLRGTTYEIATGSDVRSSDSHKKRNLVLMGGGSGVGAAIGAIAGGGMGALIGAGAGAAAGTTGAFITGKKNVKLPAETPLVFSLRNPVTVRG